MFTFTTLIQHSIGNPSYSNQTRRRNERHKNFKGRNKTVFIYYVCIYYDTVHRDPQRVHQGTTRTDK